MINWLSNFFRGGLYRTEDHILIVRNDPLCSWIPRGDATSLFNLEVTGIIGLALSILGVIWIFLLGPHWYVGFISLCTGIPLFNTARYQEYIFDNAQKKVGCSHKLYQSESLQLSLKEISITGVHTRGFLFHELKEVAMIKQKDSTGGYAYDLVLFLRSGERLTLVDYHIIHFRGDWKMIMRDQLSHFLKAGNEAPESFNSGTECAILGYLFSEQFAQHQCSLMYPKQSIGSSLSYYNDDRRDTQIRSLMAPPEPPNYAPVRIQVHHSEKPTQPPQIAAGYRPPSYQPPGQNTHGSHNWSVNSTQTNPQQWQMRPAQTGMNQSNFTSSPNLRTSLAPLSSFSSNSTVGQSPSFNWSASVSSSSSLSPDQVKPPQVHKAPTLSSLSPSPSYWSLSVSAGQTAPPLLQNQPQLSRPNLRPSPSPTTSFYSPEMAQQQALRQRLNVHPTISNVGQQKDPGEYWSIGLMKDTHHR
ncbi:DNA-directed RNA polymerase II subunit RPB1-like [Planoprotostelium fungivorum]|uniref:DNA-directed RNA polymerase II subunit RPB1-like n=1 Tax=Planoprotostelium fungivorum TaxID=1890364 RepID=A0A2P6NDZ5_9EUKA|nr:DNA-directed RNA polymerase II subunit RPB1-like [Planoprotostelium fungivorum]